MVKLLKILIMMFTLGFSGCAALRNFESSYIHTTTAMQDVVFAMTSLDSALAVHLNDAADKPYPHMTDEEFYAAAEAVLALRFARAHYIDAETELRAYRVCEAVDTLDAAIYELGHVYRYLEAEGKAPLDAQLTLLRATYTLDRTGCNGPY